ncbi:hypothetical protein KEM52_001775, partial [Ascosphaera acerosa]
SARQGRVPRRLRDAPTPRPGRLDRADKGGPALGRDARAAHEQRAGGVSGGGVPGVEVLPRRAGPARGAQHAARARHGQDRGPSDVAQCYGGAGRRVAGAAWAVVGGGCGEGEGGRAADAAAGGVETGQCQCGV